MPTDSVAQAALVAANRFGMGARPGDLARIVTDPRGALKAELARPDVALIETGAALAAGLQSTTPNIQAPSRLRRSASRSGTRRSGRGPLALPRSPPRNPSRRLAQLLGLEGSIQAFRDGDAISPPST